MELGQERQISYIQHSFYYLYNQTALYVTFARLFQTLTLYETHRRGQEIITQ